MIAAIRDPSSTPIFTCSSAIELCPNASSPTSSDTVKPIPQGTTLPRGRANAASRRADRWDAAECERRRQDADRLAQDESDDDAERDRVGHRRRPDRRDRRSSRRRRRRRTPARRTSVATSSTGRRSAGETVVYRPPSASSPRAPARAPSAATGTTKPSSTPATVACTPDACTHTQVATRERQQHPPRAHALAARGTESREREQCEA